MLKTIAGVDERTGPIVSGYSRVWEIRRGLTNLASIAAVLALALALAAAIGLIVGAILTLATLVGPGWATLIVVGVSLVVAALLGWVAARGIRKAMGARA